MLLRHHVRTEGAHQALGVSFYIIHAPEVEALGRAILEKNPNREDRGHACSSLASALEYKASMIRRMRDDPKYAKAKRESYGPEIDRLIREGDPEKMEAETERLRERVIAEFGDVPLNLPDWPDKRTIGQIETGLLFAQRHLNVGKPAPEIEGKDEQGQTFKLSESRGKVVVLTFSGNWCGPCVAMYPTERELVERSKREPIAVLSVNTDEKVETLRQAVSEGKITWRCWWDGGVDGPITTQWGVQAFPQVFVIDREGVIRYKNVRDQELKDAVDRLLN